ncbi:transketolase [[Mycoplasma] phocae]|uniref:Transketolase n=1 Tax=[Mycoplasma] phocae TaxID=142651 RepID=A0A2Z5IPS6_9BACT|nr:1-deoxy-D-xylulose-5-phosphate synthase N-terminal domain-containing protein [[Mycoplasma] phocae]AXE60743.1 transketolase [[Mycoplasma] phocae]
MKNNKRFDKIAVDNLKINALATILNTNNNHPNMLISAAKIFHAVFFYHLKFDANNPNWVARDRFILSSTHGSQLYYSMLKMIGLISEEQLRNYGKKDSDLPLTIEKNAKYCIDFSSGSLSQGVGVAVGLAVAEAHMSNKFPEVSHFTYVLCNESDLQEGSAYEALTYAGMNGLNKLIVLYDSNSMEINTLDSRKKTNNKKKYEAINFNYIFLNDATTLSISKAIKKAKNSTKPTFIEIRTEFSEMNFLTDGIEKSEFNEEVLEKIKEKSSFQKNDFFASYAEVTQAYKEMVAKNSEKFNRWSPSNELLAFLSDEIKENINDINTKDDISYENATYSIVNNLANNYGNIFICNNSVMSTTNNHYLNGVFEKNNLDGRTILLGNREMAMANIACGLALHSNIRPIVFIPLSYATYISLAIKMAAINKSRVLFVFVNDLVLFSTGQINQPIEQLMLLRSIPNLTTMRPFDIKELKGSFEYYLNNTTNPAAILISDNIIPVIKETSKNEFKAGSYYLLNSNNKFTLISTGFDLKIMYNIAKKLNLSLISASNMNNLRKMKYDRNYTISFESMSTSGWKQYAKYNIGIDNYEINEIISTTQSKLEIDEKHIESKIINIINKNSNKEN